MKSQKLMLSGIMCALVAIYCVTADGRTGSSLGAVSLIILPIGLILFLAGILSNQ